MASIDEVTSLKAAAIKDVSSLKEGTTKEVAPQEQRHRRGSRAQEQRHSGDRLIKGWHDKGSRNTQEQRHHGDRLRQEQRHVGDRRGQEPGDGLDGQDHGTRCSTAVESTKKEVLTTTASLNAASKKAEEEYGKIIARVDKEVNASVEQGPHGSADLHQAGEGRASAAP